MTLKENFLKLYPDSLVVYTSFCPYRVCPMGAHSDHQYGQVLGFAIDKGITIAFTPTENGVIEFSSLNFEGRKQYALDKQLKKKNDWADYVRGAITSLSRKYPISTGLYALIEGSLPIGGLSSSAAVIIAFVNALCKVNNIVLSSKELIEIALWAENEFVGLNVGKLDQSCEILCKKNHLLYLDTKDDTYQLIPENPNMKPYEIAIFFSGVERTLVGSAFNMRVDELKAASYALKGFAGIEYGNFKDTRLRDVPKEIFEKYKDNLPENWRKRATHFYTEFDRVSQGVKAWKEGDLEQFGKLCFESGHSSIYNYETGSRELKVLYEIMLKTQGIYGGRFSGAGFKGCCMAIIDPEFKESIKEYVTKEYLKVFPSLKEKFSAHFCKTADGCYMR